MGFYAVEPQNSTKKIYFSKFYGQKQGPGTSLKCEKIRDSTSVKILPSLFYTCLELFSPFLDILRRAGQSSIENVDKSNCSGVTLLKYELSSL